MLALFRMASAQVKKSSWYRRRREWILQAKAVVSVTFRELQCCISKMETIPFPPELFLTLEPSVQFSLVTQLCPTLCDTMDCSTPSLPVHHQTPWVYSNSCPLSRWCHPTISSSVVPFSSHLQSLPASGSFQMSQFFKSGEQILQFQLQHQSFQWTPKADLLWDGLVGSPCSPRDSQESSPTPQFKSINSSMHSFMVQLSHPYMTTGKAIVLTTDLCWQSNVSAFNKPSRLVIAFLPRSKYLLISWVQSPSAVILEPPKIKSITVFTVSPFICHEVIGPDAMILLFWMLSFKPIFSLLDP